ncbi:MAG: YkgJ family cysteine cluster protein [Myxococcales bacterium]|nr:YkgJ family cysteine cluster protein [Myxococcales bacterium]
MGARSGMGAEEAAAALVALHAEVDAEVAPLVTRHGARLTCQKGCSQCCVDDLTVFEVEAARIRANHAALLAEGQPHPAGACAFLDEAGACRIYPDRPYVCRTQGLPLRWEDEDDAGAWVERRDICALNEAGEPDLVALPAEDCWTLGPVEGRLATLQVRLTARPDRVRLRDLFEVAAT